MGIGALFIALKERSWMLAVGLLVGSLAALGTALLFPKEYRSTAHVQVDSLQQNLLTGLFEPRVRVAEFLGQQSAIAASRTVGLRVYDRLVNEGLLHEHEIFEEWRDKTGGDIVAGNDPRLWAADQLLSNVEIEADSIKSTLSISFRSDGSGQSAFIANAFANAYMDTILSKRQMRAARNAENFSDETTSLQQEIELAQRDLTAFRRQSGIVGLGEKRLENSEVELATVTIRLAEAQADLAEAKSLLRKAHDASSRDLLTIPLPQNATTGRQAQARLGAVHLRLQSLSERYGERYPGYVEVLNEKKALERTILKSIEDLTDFTERRVKALSENAESKKVLVVALQETKQTFDVLEKRVDATRDTYDLVASRSLQESLQSRVGVVDVMMLARAVPSENPVTPPTVVIILIGAIAGAILAGSTAVAIELIEGRVRSADTVVRILRAPVLAEVNFPTFPKARKTAA